MDCDTENKITEQIMSAVFITFNEFHKCRLHTSESLSIVYELKKLLDEAMRGMDAMAREQLLLHQFLGGLPLSDQSCNADANSRNSEM